ncbi:MAG TPA: lipopolysaccharide assembly protein LapB [Azoarcus sp.]|nr:lipopolysaccharide assembly protein LapB [Azoarcus sp.]
MEIEYWWLFTLPLFFALGWVAARIDIRQVVRESRALPRAWLKGLNFLVDEKQDRAIDAFSEAARIDPDSIDLQFALGALYRRRGETEQAVRIHQGLVDRDVISENKRLDALAALGQDYLNAGLLDRAEGVCIRLRGTRYSEEATRHLLDIYQQEREWLKAVEVARSLSGHEGVHWRKEIANFYCELAADALANVRYDEARGYIDEAVAMNRGCVRANIVLGDLHLAEGRVEEAIEAWKRIEKQDPIYLSLVAERVMDAFSSLGRAEHGRILLRSWLDKKFSLDLLDVVFRHEIEHAGPQAAYTLIRDQLRINPTLQGLEKLLDAAARLTEGEQQNDVELVRQLVHEHTRRVARYRCTGCGFKSRQFQWRCPACGGWETYPPRRTEEFDLDD